MKAIAIAEKIAGRPFAQSYKHDSHPVDHI
jgi:hypothetical protein